MLSLWDLLSLLPLHFVLPALNSERTTSLGDSEMRAHPLMAHNMMTKLLYHVAIAVRYLAFIPLPGMERMDTAPASSL